MKSPLRAARALLVAGLSLAAPAGAVEMEVVRFDRSHGLCGHPVTGLIQDGEDRVWIATLGGGAYRYDGREFRRFTSRDGVISDDIVALVPGAKGEMWLSAAAGSGSEGGLSVVVGDRVLEPIDGADWEANVGLLTSQGTVWFGFRSGGVARYDGSVLKPVAGLDGVRVTRMVESDGSLWLIGRPVRGDVTDPSTLYQFSNGSFRPQGAADGLPRVPFHDLLADAKGGLWLATDRGLFHRPKGRFVAVTAEGARLDRPILSLSQDAQGGLWMGGEGRVLALREGRAVELDLPFELGPLPVLEIVAAPQGGVFARTPSYLLRLEGHTAEVLPLPAVTTLLDADQRSSALAWEARLDTIAETARNLLVDHEGGVWALVGDEVIRYGGDDGRKFGRGEGLSSEDAQSILADSRGRVWVGSDNGLAVFEPRLGVFRPIAGVTRRVRAIFEDRAGVIYAGTDGGVVRVDDAAAATPWRLAAGLAPVNGFAAADDGRMWLATDHGVAYPNLDGMQTLAQPAGLADAPATAIIANEGDLWVGHAGGLSRRDGERLVRVPGFDGTTITGFVAAPQADATARQVVALTAAGLRAVPSGDPVVAEVGRGHLGAALVTADRTWVLALNTGLLRVRDGIEVLAWGNGLPNSTVRAIAEDSSGAIWLVTGTGVYRQRPHVQAPRVHMDLAGQMPSGPVRLAQDERLEVGLDAISYLGPAGASEVQMMTRVAPLETEWGPPTRVRRLTLGPFLPGRYQFEARALTRELALGPVRVLHLEVADGSGQVPADPGATKPPPAGRLVLPDIARPVPRR